MGACWEWTGARDWDGYGLLQVDGRPQRAARLAFAWFVRPLVDGEVVRHRCDNPPCCNPAHLVAGSPAENSGDMVERQRSARGVRNAAARLTEGRVILIRQRHAAGASIAQLARDEGVSESAIRSIVTGQWWRHVGGPIADVAGTTSGERNGQAVLSADQVRAIRRAYTGRRGEQAALAREYSVTPGAIRLIVRRENWRHLED